jgi:hypothetical protein
MGPSEGSVSRLSLKIYSACGDAYCAAAKIQKSRLTSESMQEKNKASGVRSCTAADRPWPWGLCSQAKTRHGACGRIGRNVETVSYTTHSTSAAGVLMNYDI